MTSSEIRETLTEQIEQQGKTPSGLSRQLGHAPNWLARKLDGERPMSLEELCQIADILGVAVSLTGQPIKNL